MKVLSNLFAIIWFFGVLLWTLFLGTIAILMILFSDIVGMLKSGFSTSTIGFVFCFLAGLILAITGWVPAFRKCYYKLPWLYPYSMMMMMHLVILSIAEAILAKGFSVISTPRHVAAIIIMVIQIIVCRAVMCVYLKKYPMVLCKDDSVE